MGWDLRVIFSKIPRTYECINRAITLGFDRRWRQAAARIAARGGGRRWLDLCTGTGELAVMLQSLAGAGTKIFAADFAWPMLELASSKRSTREISFAVSEARRLCFAGGSFDLVTTAFATRNLNVTRAILIETLSEIRRVLRSGGRLVMLETSQPQSRTWRALSRLYVRIAVPVVGRTISGSSSGYAYLAHSIPRFYTADELKALFLQAGFEQVEFHRQLGGVVAIHEAVNPESQSSRISPACCALKPLARKECDSTRSNERSHP